MFLALALSEPSGTEMKAMGVGVSLGQEKLLSLACIVYGIWRQPTLKLAGPLRPQVMTNYRNNAMYMHVHAVAFS